MIGADILKKTYQRRFRGDVEFRKRLYGVLY